MDWERVWRRIDERRVELGWSKAALYEQTSTSEPTYRKMRGGIGVVADAKRRAITNALGWTPDSIDLILAGGEPIVVEPDTDALSSLRAEVLELAQVVRMQATRIDQLTDAVAELRASRRARRTAS